MRMRDTVPAIPKSFRHGMGWKGIRFPAERSIGAAASPEMFNPHWMRSRRFSNSFARALRTKTAHKRRPRPALSQGLKLEQISRTAVQACLIQANIKAGATGSVLFSFGLSGQKL